MNAYLFITESIDLTRTMSDMLTKQWRIRTVNIWNNKLPLGNITIEEVLLLKRMRFIL